MEPSRKSNGKVMEHDIMLEDPDKLEYSKVF